MGYRLETIHPGGRRRQGIGKFRYRFIRDHAIFKDFRHATRARQADRPFPALCRVDDDKVFVRVERLTVDVVNVNARLAEEFAEQVRRR